jgi:ribosomal protein S6--L-glutamate ligase
VTRLYGARIELWVEERGGAAAVNPVMRALLDDLAAAGASIAVRVPELELVDPEQLRHVRRPDLVLLKTAAGLALSLAIADACYGVRFLNGARETIRAHDKAATVARLAAAGLPVPETYLVGGSAERTPANQAGAWVTKPTRGVHGRGVQMHAHYPTMPISPTRFEAIDSYVIDDGTRLVQRLIGGAQPDVKVYVAGERYFAGAKQFGNASFASDQIEPVALTPADAAIVLGVGQALGLRCFGVDLRYEDHRPVVIDANPFPGYRGFPGAVSALRFEIEHALESNP